MDYVFWKPIVRWEIGLLDNLMPKGPHKSTAISGNHIACVLLWSKWCFMMMKDDVFQSSINIGLDFYIPRAERHPQLGVFLPSSFRQDPLSLKSCSQVPGYSTEPTMWIGVCSGKQPTIQFSLFASSCWSSLTQNPYDRLSDPRNDLAKATLKGGRQKIFTELMTFCWQNLSS